MKSVTSVALNGALVFADTPDVYVYPGITSKLQVFEHCGILHQISPFEMILADERSTLPKHLPQGACIHLYLALL